MMATTPDHTDIDFWSSYPINWPALFTIAGLVLALIGLHLWWGDYGDAGKLGLILMGGAGLTYARVMDRWEKASSARWHWGSILIWGIVGVWSGLQLAQAWMSTG